MKKLITITAAILISIAPLEAVHADPISEVIKAAITKIIKAMDLAVQRLQNETIKLQNIQKAIENTMAKLKLQEITDWAQKQHDIFSTYYDELKKVRTIIAQYREVRQMVQAQVDLVNEYKSIITIIRQSQQITPNNLRAIENIYSQLLNDCEKNVEVIISVVRSFSLQMSDAARLHLINEATQQIKSTTAKFRSFNQQNIMYILERSRDQHEIETLKSIYGLPKE